MPQPSNPCQWQDSADGQRFDLMENNAVIATVYFERLDPHNGSMWRASFLGEPLRGFWQTSGAAQIAVANARGRAKMPNRVLYREAHES